MCLNYKYKYTYKPITIHTGQKVRFVGQTKSSLEQQWNFVVQMSTRQFSQWK